MVKLYILSGYPFAGKSTVARALVEKFGLVRIALDDINTERGIGADPSKKITQEEWQTTYDTYHNRIVQNLEEGKSVITDTVAHKRESRDGLRKLARENNAEAIVLYVATPLEVAKERWLRNRHTKERSNVQDDNFYEVVDSYEVPGKDENVIAITSDMNIDDVYKLIG